MVISFLMGVIVGIVVIMMIAVLAVGDDNKKT